MRLDVLGLDHAASVAYETLVDRRLAQVGEIAQALEVDIGVAEKSLRELERHGLVTRTPDVPPEYAAVAPEPAIESLVQRRMAELADLRRDAARLGERHRQHRDPPPSVVELVSGYEATLAWALQVQRSADEEVCLIDVPPYVLPPGPPNPVEPELLARGIRYRVLYHTTSFEFPEKRAAAAHCIERGEQARLYSGTPIKMILADRKLGFTYDTQVQPIRDSLLVHPSFLLEQLRMLFDLLWSRAAPVAPGDDGARERHRTPLNALDREILVLMLAGVKDEAISRQLDIGLRTVRRRVASLMDYLGASTRFQAGFLAAKSDLL